MISRYDMYEPYHPDGPDVPDELLTGESLRCGACREPARSWIYQVSHGEDGSSIIAGFAVCTAHQAAA